MNNNTTIKQLKKEKEKKLKEMSLDDITSYIKRTVAFYYSHYADLNLIYDITVDDIDKHNKECMEFKESFNNNMDMIIKNIQNEFNVDNTVKQLRVNYILCVLYSSISENLVLNHEKENEKLKKIFDDLNELIDFQYNLHCLVIGFISFVNKSYSLFNQCKKVSIMLYEFISVYTVNDVVFDVLNTYFKDLFIEFYMNYLCCKNSDFEDLFENVNVTGLNVDSAFEDVNIKNFYLNAVDKLSEIDKEFELFIKDNDLFSYPKSIFKDKFDNSVVYDLKRFDIDYVIEDNIVSDLFSENVISDEYKQLELMEDKLNVKILFDVGSDDVGVGVDSAILNDVEISDLNIEMLEEMFL